jgi:glycosyltransferase involved in cell wall biosynthesis
MRVALITENFLPKLDGVTRTLATLLEHLERHGHQAMVLGPQGGPHQYAGAPVFGAPGLPLPMYPELRMLFPPRGFERLLARFQPDVVHVVDPMALGAAGIRWARRLGVPVISSYHTNLAAYCDYYHLSALSAVVWSYRRFLHNQTTLTLCPSPSTATRLRSQEFARVAVWARGVDAQLFDPERRSTEWRERVAGDSSRTIVLYVGRLSYEKNLQSLLSAYLGVASEDTRLVLVGDGPARAELERTLAGRGVAFTGYLRGEQLAQAYASADVFAFPSLTETFGQVVLEAMASGLPVLAYNAEGVCDLVQPGETGMLVRSGDGAAFERGLAQLLADPAARASLGSAGHAAAVERRWDAVMDGLLDEYRRLVVVPGVLAA